MNTITGSLLLDAIIAGIATGAVYGLIAIGFTVVYDATRVFNLAQGDLVMTGIMISYVVLRLEHWPQLAGLGCAVAAACAISLIEERVAVRKFLGQGERNLGWFISTLAFSLLIESIALILYGQASLASVPSPFSDQGINAGPISISPQYLLAIVVFVAIALLSEVFYRKTQMGRAMRAVSQDRGLARLKGINTVAMSRTAFLIGGLIAGLAGFIVAPITGANVAVGLTYTFKGFVVLAIGGFGSRLGAMIGAFVLGIAEQLFDVAFGGTYEVVVGAVLLLLVLTFRPRGMLGVQRVRNV